MSEEGPVRNLACKRHMNDSYSAVYRNSLCAEYLFQWLPKLRPKQKGATWQTSHPAGAHKCPAASIPMPRSRYWKNSSKLLKACLWSCRGELWWMKATLQLSSGNGVILIKSGPARLSLCINSYLSLCKLVLRDEHFPKQDSKWTEMEH